MEVLGQDITQKILKKLDLKSQLRLGQSSRQMRDIVNQTVKKQKEYKEIEEVLKKLGIEIDPIKYIILKNKRRCVECMEETRVYTQVRKRITIKQCDECRLKDVKRQELERQTVKRILGEEEEEKYKKQREKGYKYYNNRKYIVKEIEEYIERLRQTKGKTEIKEIEREMERRKDSLKMNLSYEQDEVKRRELQQICYETMKITRSKEREGFRVIKEYEEGQKTRGELRKKMMEYKGDYEEERKKQRKEIGQMKRQVKTRGEEKRREILERIQERYDIKIQEGYKSLYISGADTGQYFMEKIIRKGYEEKVWRKMDDEEGQRIGREIQQYKKGDYERMIEVARKYMDGDREYIRTFYYSALRLISIYLLLERGELKRSANKEIYIHSIYWEENKEECEIQKKRGRKKKN